MRYLVFIIISFISLNCGGSQMVTSKTDWINNQTIYEVNLRQYTEDGTISSFRQHLPRLKEMGFGILWFMPIHPIGEKNRKGELGSYYSVKDYFSVNPEFGTAEEFKSLVNEIHKMGMYVIIDWVANHTACDNEMVSANPEWYTKDKNGRFQPPLRTDWSDVYDLDYTNLELRQYMIDAMEYWVKVYDIDGFRCDVAGMVPTDFWESAVERLNLMKSVFMLAEWEDPELLEKAFKADYNWSLYHILKDISSSKKDANSIQEYFEKPKKKYPERALKMNFLDNHDENSWNRVMIEHFGNKVYPLSTMLFTLPGIPMIYSGQEARVEEKIKFFEKDTIQWNNYPDGNFYKKLINIRKNHSVFWSNNTTLEFLDGLPIEVVGFKRWDSKNIYYVLLNFSNHAQEIDSELLSNNYIVKDENSTSHLLASNGYFIFKTEK